MGRLAGLAGPRHRLKPERHVRPSAGATVVERRDRSGGRHRVRCDASLIAADYVALAKPRLNVLVVVTSCGRHYLGARHGSRFGSRWASASVGTALVAGGAAVLNQVYERDTDALMRRTRLRPLPDGRVGRDEARAFGIVLAAGGSVLASIAPTCPRRSSRC